MFTSAPRRSASSPRGAMSAGCLCGRGSGTARPDSPAAMPASRGGTVRSTAAGSSFARGPIAANGATIAPCKPRSRRRSGRPAPRSRGRTPARCVPRSGRFALPPLSNGRIAPHRRRRGSRSSNRRRVPRREKTVGPGRGGMPRRRRGRWKSRRLLPVPSPRHVRRSARRCGSPKRRSRRRRGRWRGRRLLPAASPRHVRRSG